MGEARWHTNQNTGKTSQCHAEIQCRLKGEHFSTEEEARKDYENKNLEKLFAPLTKKKEMYTYDPDGLRQASRDYQQTKNEEKREQILVWMRKNGVRNHFAANIRAADIEREKEWIEEIETRRYVPIEPTAPTRDPFTNVVGIEKARKEMILEQNEYESSPGTYMIYYGAENDINQALDRALNGEVAEPEESGYFKNHEDEVLGCMTAESGNRRIAQLRLATVWTEKDLKPVLERLGIENVEVGSFDNCREWGLTYTVDDPSVGKRTFSVYTHRNSDSIIINGESNWTKEKSKYPFAGENSGSFFAEIPCDGEKQAAETLGYFLKSAQKGELEDDDTLINKAEHLDWGAILSKQLPRFDKFLDRFQPGWNDRKRGFED